MEGDLTPSSAPLADLCHVLGITTTELAAVESADDLTHIFPVQSADAARLDAARVRAFVDHYGEAARVELLTDKLSEIVIEPGVTDAAVAAFAAQAGLGGPYQAFVHVDKACLVHRIAGPEPARKVRIFLFAEALRRTLERGIAQFEADVWPEAPAPLVLGVLDTDISLCGTHLGVFGGAALPQARVAAATALSDFDFTGITASRDRNIGWDTRWVRALTPWHFDLSGTCADGMLHGILRAQLVKLAVLFTCDRARTRAEPTPPGEILAEYRGREHVAVVTIDERAPVDATAAETEAVLRVVDWCYQRYGANNQPDWVSDRLPFVQTRLAQFLEPHPANERLTIFTTAMPYLLEGIEWNWKAFIEGKVSDYLDRVQQVETVVNDTVSSFADRATALVKGLTDTILAAVAVLIGSFIAAAFHTPFNAALFRIGVLTYAGYVLLFPGAVGLIAAASNLRILRAAFDTRIVRFNETLYPEKVTEIVGSRVDNAQCSFYRWFAFAAAAYLAVAIAAGVAATTVPHLVLHVPANHQTASLITTSAPPTWLAASPLPPPALFDLARRRLPIYRGPPTRWSESRCERIDPWGLQGVHSPGPGGDASPRRPSRRQPC